MPDNLENRGPRDASRINLNEPWELRYWSEKFGVSPAELSRAVERVGVMVANVERELVLKR